MKELVRKIIIIHVARTWERIRLKQSHQEMPMDNLQSVETIMQIADEILQETLVKAFILTENGDVWDLEGDGMSDNYIERKAEEIIYQYI